MGRDWPKIYFMSILFVLFLIGFVLSTIWVQKTIQIDKQNYVDYCKNMGIKYYNKGNTHGCIDQLGRIYLVPSDDVYPSEFVSLVQGIALLGSLAGSIAFFCFTYSEYHENATGGKQK